MHSNRSPDQGVSNDNNNKQQHQTTTCLKFDTVVQEFLLEIQASPNVEYGELADILVRQAQSADEVTRMTALRWLRAFVTQAKDQLMPYYADILAAVLPNVSHNNQDICQVRNAASNSQTNMHQCLSRAMSAKPCCLAILYSQGCLLTCTCAVMWQSS